MAETASIQLVEKELYRLLKRKRPETLARWWEELNRWRWPKEIPSPEDRDEPNFPRRTSIMYAIAQELGYRWICNRIGWRKS